MVRTLVVDNYDSFTYNLYALLAAVNGAEPTVIRNDSQWDAIDFDCFGSVVISPGREARRTPMISASARASSPNRTAHCSVCASVIRACVRCGAHASSGPPNRCTGGCRHPAHRQQPVSWTAVCVCGGSLSLAGSDRPARRIRRHRMDDRRADHGGAPPEQADVGCAVPSESIASECGRELLTNFRDSTPLVAVRQLQPRVHRIWSERRNLARAMSSSTSKSITIPVRITSTPNCLTVDRAVSGLTEASGGTASLPLHHHWRRRGAEC